MKTKGSQQVMVILMLCLPYQVGRAIESTVPVSWEDMANQMGRQTASEDKAKSVNANTIGTDEKTPDVVVEPPAFPQNGAINTQLRSTVGTALELDGFLSQVRERDPGMKGSQASFESAVQAVEAADLPLSFRVFTNTYYMDDAKPQLFFRYDKQMITHIEAGVSKQTSFGLLGKFSYISERQKIQGLQFPGTPTSVEALWVTPKLELTLSLWRNFLGSEVSSQVAMGEANSLSQKHMASFSQKSKIVQAEVSYWSLVLAREAVLVARASVERAQKLFDWHQRRAELGLGDRSDFLQSQAGLQARKLELKKFEDDSVIASRAFNLARGLDSLTVEEKLVTLSPSIMSKFQIPARQNLRDDLRAAQEQKRFAEAKAEIDKQSSLPTLELYGSAARSNPDVFDTNKAYSEAFSASRPSSMIGLRLDAPLDFGASSALRKSATQQRVAAQYTYERKFLEQEKEWAELTDKFQQAKLRLSMYIQLEGMQKTKVEYERERRGKGLTTTQLVLLSETEYEQTQFNRIRTISEILQIVAQMKLYGENI